MDDLPKFEPDVSAVMSSVRLVAEMVDSRWVARRLAQAASQKPPKDLSKHSYLYRPPEHPLIELFRGFEEWREECIRTRRFALNERALALSLLGRSIETVLMTKNAERAMHRLKNPNQFHAAAFEIEVAASYVARGYSVEFIEEGQEKTPDLLVMPNSRPHFWVECKRRDLMSDEEITERQLWLQIEQRLFAHCGPRKLNFMVTVETTERLTPSDVPYLTSLLIDQVNSLAANPVMPIGEYRTPISDNTGRFGLVVAKIAEPDAEIEATGFGISMTRTPNHVSTTCEMRREADGKQFLRNPKAIAFAGTLGADRIAGIVSSLQAARKQLPASGPGVVWIRVPDNAWSKDLNGSFDQARKLLTQSLSGDRNRRINAAYVMTRTFERLQDGDLVGLGYRPLIAVIDHDNPRYPLSQSERAETAIS